MKMTFLILAASCISTFAFCQSDSINSYLIGMNKGEKYKVVYKGNIVVEKKCRNINCECTFLLSKGELKEGDLIEIYIYRKGRFGLVYKNTDFNVRYTPEFKYLIIFRNERLKDRYAIDSKWTNERVMTE